MRDAGVINGSHSKDRTLEMLKCIPGLRFYNFMLSVIKMYSILDVLLTCTECVSVFVILNFLSKSFISRTHTQIFQTLLLRNFA